MEGGKCGCLWRYSASLKLDILLLHETHFPVRYSPKFLHAYYPTLFLANTDTKTKGIAILFSKHSKFSMTAVHKDPVGRYILVKGTMEGTLFSLVSYYAPNAGQH